MNTTSPQNQSMSARKAFKFATNSQSKPKRISPVSVRFTPEERERLQHSAGRQSLSAYVRRKALDGDVSPRKALQVTSIDHALIGKVLGMLGQSRLSQNMNQIAKGLNMGTLPVTPDVVMDVSAACDDIRLMRDALIAALGLRR